MINRLISIQVRHIKDKTKKTTVSKTKSIIQHLNIDKNVTERTCVPKQHQQLLFVKIAAFMDA